jgi:hypothetical protein
VKSRNKSVMGRANLAVWLLGGAFILAAVCSSAQAQTRKELLPSRGPCKSGNHESCRTAQQVGNYTNNGQTDYAIWRPSNGTWFVLSSYNKDEYLVQQWGEPGDIPVPADYDGDGITDFAIWRPSTGVWWILPSSAPGTYYTQQWGVSGDIPVPGDYEGTGEADIAVWRPSNGVWYLLSSANPGTYIVQQWGMSGDIPMPGSYDGSGQIDYSIWRPSTGTWFVLSTFNPAEYLVQQWGLEGDNPVSGDFDGDGTYDFAIWRPSTGVWWILPSSSPGTYTTQQWGVSGDLPEPGDYDGSGATSIAVWRSSNGVWYVIPASGSAPYLTTQWGLPGDEPAVNIAPEIGSSGAEHVITQVPNASSATREEEMSLLRPPAEKEVHPLSDAEMVIGPQQGRSIEQAVKSARYLLPKGYERQVGFTPPALLIRPVSDAYQSVGAPQNVRPEEVGKTNVLSFSSSDGKRP